MMDMQAFPHHFLGGYCRLVCLVSEIILHLKTLVARELPTRVQILVATLGLPQFE
jgi:hypothetical protein